MCLHQCLERFNLFGYHATRDRLRAHVAADRPGWTSQQILDSLALLEEARTSWLAFAEAQARHRRQLKAEGQRHQSSDLMLGHSQWLQTYLTGDQARIWQTHDLYDCTDCGHLHIEHGAYRCYRCTWSGKPWKDACKTPIPPPVQAT